MSDEPAMHDPMLNRLSFARRGAFPSTRAPPPQRTQTGRNQTETIASPRKDRLPSEHSNKPVFCHTCQTNQHLLVNLLANFLPDPADPESRVTLNVPEEGKAAPRFSNRHWYPNPAGVKYPMSLAAESCRMSLTFF